jgi:nitrous oxidase accessory protein NosD
VTKVIFAGRRPRTAVLGGGGAAPPLTPDYSLTTSALSITQGANASLVVTVTRSGGHTSAVSLTASGLPTGVTSDTATVTSASTTGTLTLTASSGAAPGAATVTITGSDGIRSRTTTLTLTVAESGTFDLYVEEGASGTGTSASPFGTITAAIAAASAGQSILVRAGTYREAVTVNKAVTIQGASGATIKGSEVLTGWSVDGTGLWGATHAAGAQTPATVDGWATMLPESAAGATSDAVYLDGVELQPVSSTGACTTGKFHQAVGRLYLGDDPTGKTVEVAERGFCLKFTADNATVRGLTVRHCRNVAQGGAMVQLNDRTGITLEDNDLGYASAAVLDISSTDSTVTGNVVHHGGQLGVTGKAFGLSFSGNEVYENNTRGYDPAWEAGGSKFHQGGAADLATAPYQGLAIHGNTFRDNVGPGLWLDVYVNGATIRRNRVHGNGWQGINVELSKNVEVGGPDGVADANIVYNNGHGITGGPHDRVEPPLWGLGAGIYVLASDNVNVHHQVLAWNADGITVWQDARETPMETVSVDDNTVIQHAASGDAYAIAYLENAGGSIAVTVGGSRNVIYGATGVYYNWLGDGASRTTNRATMATTRGDWTGTSLTLVEAQAVCAANGIPTSP